MMATLSGVKLYEKHDYLAVCEKIHELQNGMQLKFLHMIKTI